MQEPTATSESRGAPRQVWVGVFIAALAVYLLTLGRARSWLYHDGAERFAVTKAIVERGRLRIGTREDGSARYSKYGVAHSLIGAPLYLLGKAAARTGAANAFTDPVFYCSLQNSFITAATCATLVWALSGMGYGLSTSLLTAAIYGLGTVAWPNARWRGGEPLTGLCLLVLVASLARIARRGARAGDAAAAAVAGGVAVLSAAMTGPLVAACVVWTALGRARRGSFRREWKPWALAGMILLAALAAFCAYNRARTGSVFRTGYEGDHGFRTFPYSGRPGFSAPLLVGLYGNLFSVGRSVFIFSPPAALAAVFFGLLWRSRPKYARLALFCVLYYLVVWSKWRAWYGGGCWGNRALLPVLPLAMPAVAAGWERVKEKGGLRLWVFAAVALAGLAVQIPGILVYPGDHYSRVIGPRYEKEYRIHFVPHTSPLAVHVRILMSRPMSQNDLFWWKRAGPAEPAADPPEALRVWGVAALALLLAAGVGKVVRGSRAVGTDEM